MKRLGLNDLLVFFLMLLMVGVVLCFWDGCNSCDLISKDILRRMLDAYK
ncbi:MAG: hypothetical protein HQL97_17205 [Magnetococcales bacterium]|nr:hypothetical protein [Magnetococcales bacterium]